MSLSKRRAVPAMSGRRARPATLLFSGKIPFYVSLCSLELYTIEENLWIPI
jgi:hypothetical protein